MSFYNGVKSAAGIFLKIFYRINVYGKENINTNGNLIICGNHSHNLDPIFVSIAYPKQIYWMGKKELFVNKFLAKFFDKLGAFPVDREASDLSAIKNSLRILKRGEVLGIFPEGTRVKELNLDNAKAGIALISIKSKSPILPVYIESNFKLFSKVNIYFGEIIDFKDKYDTKLSTEEYTVLSREVLQSIYAIKEKEDDK